MPVFLIRFGISFGTTATLDRAEIVKHLAIINYRSRTSNNLKTIIKKSKKNVRQRMKHF